MRWAVCVAGFLLTGCAGAIDAATKAQNAVSAITAAAIGDVELEQALIRDIGYKSAQLAFVSKNTYTCGDPRDPYWQMVTKLTPINDKARRELIAKWSKRKSELKEKISDNKTFLASLTGLRLILEYGQTLTEVTKWVSETKTTTDKLRAALDAFKADYPPLAKSVVSAFEQSITLFVVAGNVIADGRILDLAKKAQPVLAEAQRLANGNGSMRVMTAAEHKAFHHWNSCAVERLEWLRDHYPPIRFAKGDGTWSDERGVAPSPVLMFAAEYQSYLTDRENFLAKRADYRSLIQAIIDANDAIIRVGKSPPDINYVLDNLAYIGSNSANITAEYEKLRKEVEALEAQRR